MLQELIKEHAGDIANLLGSKYGLTSDQASHASNVITDAVSGFMQNQLSSGKLDTSEVADLFNKNTPNESNSLFSGLSSTISSALTSKSGLPNDVISKISSFGLNDILGIFQSGKLGNMDLSSIASMISQFTGNSGRGLGNIMGEVGGLLGEKK